MQQEAVYVVAGVLAGGVLAQWLAWRLRVPAIVFLLAGGLIAGPVLGLVDPDRTIGDLLFPAVSIAVAVILFEGALGLGWRGVRAAGSTVWMLLTVGAVVTIVGIAVAGRYVLDVDWNLAVLLGTVLVVTGPTVIGPIVSAIGLRGRVAAILEAEGTLIDPMGAILTVLVFDAVFAADAARRSIPVEVLTTFAIGAAIGLAVSVLLVVAFARYLIPDPLDNVTTLACVVGAFAIANAFRDESGLVAAVVMGMALATQTSVSVRHVLEFNETLRIIFISGLFVLLGARIEADTLREFEWRNVVFLCVLVLLVRPVAVALSTLGSGLGKRERLFLACTAQRGIVAAAIASVFSLELAEMGVEDSQVLVATTFTVIAGTVLLSGLGSGPLARRLGLVHRGGGGVVVLGANAFARELAGALEQHGAPVRIVDLDRRELAAARMTGLPAQRGSVFADNTWEAGGIEDAACFVAVTSNDELNTLAARHAAAIIGRRSVYQLPPSRAEHRAWWTLPAGTFARPLFGRDVVYADLDERVAQGWKVTSTHITDMFGPDDHARTHPGAIPLFVVDGRGNIDLWSADTKRRVRAGDTLVTLAEGGARASRAEE